MRRRQSPRASTHEQVIIRLQPRLVGRIVDEHGVGAGESQRRARLRYAQGRPEAFEILNRARFVAVVMRAEAHRVTRPDGQQGLPRVSASLECCQRTDGSSSESSGVLERTPSARHIRSTLRVSKKAERTATHLCGCELDQMIGSNRRCPDVVRLPRYRMNCAVSTARLKIMHSAQKRPGRGRRRLGLGSTIAHEQRLIEVEHNEQRRTVGLVDKVRRLVRPVDVGRRGLLAGRDGHDRGRIDPGDRRSGHRPGGQDARDRRGRMRRFECRARFWRQVGSRWPCLRRLRGGADLRPASESADRAVGRTSSSASKVASSRPAKLSTNVGVGLGTGCTSEAPWASGMGTDCASLALRLRRCMRRLGPDAGCCVDALPGPAASTVARTPSSSLTYERGQVRSAYVHEHALDLLDPPLQMLRPSLRLGHLADLLRPRDSGQGTALGQDPARLGRRVCRLARWPSRRPSAEPWHAPSRKSFS